MSLHTLHSHVINTAKYLDYVVPYPEQKYYGAGSMSGNERAKYLACYEDQKDKMFQNKDELMAYCMDDVNVFGQTCCAFRELFLTLFNMDPLGNL